MFNLLVLRMALGSLLRRRSRSVLVILMISLSLWGLLFLEGMYDGMTEQMIENSIRSTSGDVVLHGTGYRQERDLNLNIVTSVDVVGQLDRDSRVASYAIRIVQDGLLATARGARPAMVIGLQPEMEMDHGRLHEYMETGQFEFGVKGNRAVIGARLAERLKLQVGNKLVISLQDTSGEVVSMMLRVAGLIRTNTMGFDDSAVLIDFNQANELLQMQGAVSQISILLHVQADAHGLQQDLVQKFPNLEVFRWDEIAPVLLQLREMMVVFNQVTSGLVFCVAGLGIFGVVLVSVLERMREFGIMLAIGTPFRHIGLQIFYESTILGLTGFALGSLLGGGTLWYFKIHGLDLSIMSEGLNAFGIDSLAHAVIRLEYFGMALVAVFFSIVLSTVIPLRILHNSKPIQVINEN